MIKQWVAFNLKTGEIFEAIEPISFKRFLIEAHILTDYAVNYIIGDNMESLQERLGSN